jgi:hypothetical protein
MTRDRDQKFKLSALVVKNLRLKTAGHVLVGFRNLDKASASVGVMHFGGVDAALLRPVAVALNFFRLALSTCAHSAYRYAIEANGTATGNLGPLGCLGMQLVQSLLESLFSRPNGRPHAVEKDR